MGEPIAMNLLRAGTPLVVWNRSPAKTASVAAAGASVAESAGAVFRDCGTVLLMLTDGAAIDAVLGRFTDTFGERVAGRTVVSMSTVHASYSAELERDIAAAGGQYVEAPVSGSRGPAERGRLVVMLAGDRSAAGHAAEILAPTCTTSVYCGPVPGALLMKHATNLLLIPTMVALAESAAFVEDAGLDMEAFGQILLAGQMASDLLRAKVPKLLARDFTVAQASVGNVAASADAAGDAVRAAGGDGRMIEAARGLLAEARESGLSEHDVMALSSLGGGAPKHST